MNINFYHPLNKKFSKIIKSLNNELRSLKKTKLNYNFLINELFYLNLKTENILLNTSPNQKNPITLVKKDLINFLERIKNFNEFKEFDKKLPKIVLHKPEMSTFENMLEFKNINKVF